MYRTLPKLFLLYRMLCLVHDRYFMYLPLRGNEWDYINLAVLSGGLRRSDPVREWLFPLPEKDGTNSL